MEESLLHPPTKEEYDGDDGDKILLHHRPTNHPPANSPTNPPNAVRDSLTGADSSILLIWRWLWNVDGDDDNDNDDEDDDDGNDNNDDIGNDDNVDDNEGWKWQWQRW